jgi:hypothetical protein
LLFALKIESLHIRFHIHLLAALKNRTRRTLTSVSRMSSFYKEPN